MHVVEQAVEAVELPTGKIYAFKLSDRVHQVDLTGDQYRDFPRRKRGTVIVRDVPSFLAYYDKHSDASSEVYADRAGRRVTAVLDAHEAEGLIGATSDTHARWGLHRVELQLKHSDSFEAWAAYNGRAMAQLAFAEFVEDHRADITSPPAADLLELAQSFQATTKVTFRSGTRLKSGQRTLSYVEEQAASGGSGDLTIPDSFDLAVPVFEGATVADPLTARLRYRINEGKLAMIYVLDRLAEVVDAAFEGIVAEVDAGVTVPILRGTPA
jgi:uncharacterized protein YfdQ (DUF2303 family)